MMWIWRILLGVALLQAIASDAVRAVSKPVSSTASRERWALSNSTLTSLTTSGSTSLTSSRTPSRTNQFNLPKTASPRKYGRPGTGQQGQNNKVGPVGRPRRTKHKVTGTGTRSRPHVPKTKSKTKAKTKHRTKSPAQTQTQKPRPQGKARPPRTRSKSKGRHRTKSHSKTRPHHGRKSTSIPVSSIEPTSIAPSSMPLSSSISSSAASTQALVVASPIPKSPWRGHKVIGYYSYHHVRTMPPDSLPWHQLTHVVFAFGSLDSTYNIGIPAKGQSAISTLFAAAKANGVKTVLSIGGWRGSTYFSEMVASNSSRSTFITSVRNIIQQYNIDGIDIDWEYPGRPGDTGTPYNETTDVPNLLLLIRQMRQTLGWRVELSAALSSSKPWSSDVSEFAELLDYGSIMSYNFAGRGQTKSGAMAPLEGAASVSSCAMNWNNAGWPWHKLTLGIPGYGRSWTLVDVLPLSLSNLTVA